MAREAKDPGLQPDDKGGLNEACKGLRLWNKWCVTNPRYTKAFDNGSFKGTDINPTYRAMKFTEQVGPYGIGWGFEDVTYDYRPTHKEGEVLVICMAKLWWIDPETGVKAICGPHAGVDYLIRNTNNKGLVTDVEAHKKVHTDVMTTAFRFLGISADVYMKLFDNSKYRDEVDKALRQEGENFGGVDLNNGASKPSENRQPAQPPPPPVQKTSAEIFEEVKAATVKRLVEQGATETRARKILDSHISNAKSRGLTLKPLVEELSVLNLSDNAG